MQEKNYQYMVGQQTILFLYSQCDSTMQNLFLQKGFNAIVNSFLKCSLNDWLLYETGESQRQLKMLEITK